MVLVPSSDGTRIKWELLLNFLKIITMNIYRMLFIKLRLSKTFNGNVKLLFIYKILISTILGPKGNAYS